MTKEEVIEKLEQFDCEMDHMDADELLLDFINDEDIRKAFNDIPKWYE